MSAREDWECARCAQSMLEKKKKRRRKAPVHIKINVFDNVRTGSQVKSKLIKEHQNGVKEAINTSLSKSFQSAMFISTSKKQQAGKNIQQQEIMKQNLTY